MDNNDYLQHYGVIGMKWGVHRARVNANKAAKAKREGNSAKANKYQARSNRLMSKHQRLAGGKKAFDRLDKQSMGKTLAQTMLMGTYGSLKYNQARAKGAGRGKAAVKGILYGGVDHATGGFVSLVEPRSVKANSNSMKRAAKGAVNRYVKR